MKRLLVAALLTVAMLTTLGATAPSASASLAANKQACPQKWWLGTWQVKQLIRCEANLIGNPGGDGSALYVAWHESRFQPKASNGSHSGLYQQALAYWSKRVQRWAPSFDHSVYNARTNIVVSLRMAKQDGTWCKDWFCADHVRWKG